MLPSGFRYVAPTTLSAVVDALAQGDARILAGGQSLLPLLKVQGVAPGTLVDINRVEGLDRLCEADGWLRIGATVRDADLESSELILERYPMIADAARRLGDPLTRNRSTFCGALAHADPAGDWSTVAVTLGADLHAIGPHGAAVYAARDFQTAMFETRLAPAELLVEARIPAPRPGQQSVYLKVERTSYDYAAVAIGMMVIVEDGLIAEASIGLTNAGPMTIHATAAAAALVGHALDDRDAIDRAAELVLVASNPASDLRGSADYKRDLLRVLTKRAVRTVAARHLEELA